MKSLFKYVLIALATALLAGCGDSKSTGSSTSTTPADSTTPAGSTTPADDKGVGDFFKAILTDKKEFKVQLTQELPAPQLAAVPAVATAVIPSSTVFSIKFASSTALDSFKGSTLYYGIATDAAAALADGAPQNVTLIGTVAGLNNSLLTADLAKAATVSFDTSNSQFSIDFDKFTSVDTTHIQAGKVTFLMGTNVAAATTGAASTATSIYAGYRKFTFKVLSYDAANNTGKGTLLYSATRGTLAAANNYPVAAADGPFTATVSTPVNFELVK